MLHPTNGNEYFIDRDGHIFRYILQFYRTDKVPTPDKVIGLIAITPQELEAELDYFMIPRSKLEELKPSPSSPSIPKFSIRHKMFAKEIDNFVATLKKIVHLISMKFYEEFLINRNFEVSIDMTFHKCDRLRIYINAPPAGIKATIQKMLEPFERIGFLLFESSFGPDIGKHISTTMTGVTWNLIEHEKIVDSNCLLKLYDLRISIVDTLDHDDIISNTCLGQTENLYSKNNLVESY
ncbi:hypothetical protein G9A89_010635 [Geosiphon pyriformis]|nr:hypothetical protein G9A89_010635 [Geosiphon pyriformis]